MLRTPSGHLLLIGLIVFTLISGYAVRKAESERPLSQRDYSKPYPGQLLDPRLDWGEPPNKSEFVGHPSRERLVKKFYSSPDPIYDAVLMRTAISGGNDALAGLFGDAGKATPRQLDALVALIAYVQPDYTKPSAMELFTHFSGQINKAYLAERIRVWLQDKSLSTLKQPMQFLLATCGGSTAKAVLDEIYDLSLATKNLEIPSPPYEIPEDVWPLERSENTGHSYRTSCGYETEDGARYVAFTYEGLISYRDVYLGVDVDSNNEFEEVLPTGLLDVSNYSSFQTHGKQCKNMSVAVDGDIVLLGYNAPVFESRQPEKGRDGLVYYYGFKPKFKTAKLSLEELRKDTDSDGLTDITEKLLFLRKDSNDTDGDGMGDATDPSPNTNNDSMRILERGVCRVLIDSTSNILSHSVSATLKGKEHPFRTSFITFRGCSTVPYYLDELTRCISLDTIAERNAYTELDKGTGLRSFTEVTVFSIQDWNRPQDLDSQSELSMYKWWFEGELPSQTKFVVIIEGWGPSRLIPLCEVEGELYPAAIILETERGIL